MEQRGFSSGRSGMAAADNMQRVLRHRLLVTAPIDDRALPDNVLNMIYRYVNDRAVADTIKKYEVTAK